MNKINTKTRRFVGLDVHADTISVAIAEKAAVRSLGTIPNREESIRRLVKKLNEGGEWASLLRGRAYRLHAVLATDQDRDRM